MGYTHQQYGKQFCVIHVHESHRRQMRDIFRHQTWILYLRVPNTTPTTIPHSSKRRRRTRVAKVSRQREFPDIGKHVEDDKRVYGTERKDSPWSGGFGTHFVGTGTPESDCFCVGGFTAAGGEPFGRCVREMLERGCELRVDEEGVHVQPMMEYLVEKLGDEGQGVQSMLSVSFCVE